MSINNQKKGILESGLNKRCSNRVSWRRQRREIDAMKRKTHTRNERETEAHVWQYWQISFSYNFFIRYVCAICRDMHACITDALDARQIANVCQKFRIKKVTHNNKCAAAMTSLPDSFIYRPTALKKDDRASKLMCVRVYLPCIECGCFSLHHISFVGNGLNFNFDLWFMDEGFAKKDDGRWWHIDTMCMKWYFF